MDSARRYNYGGRMIGQKLGKYTIIDSIGSGSMGAVYRAEDCVGGRPVAIKIVGANILYDAEKRERFLQGLLVASEIRHPGLCPILEIGDQDDDFFIVSPFLEGETLEGILRRGNLPWQQVLPVALAAGEALTSVHAAGIAHRAIKPANIWIQGGHHVVLTDCCVARFTEIVHSEGIRAQESRTDFANTVIPMHALAYMSPEQIRGDSADVRSDIFAFGVVLYETLTGRHPFEARNSPSQMSAILEANPVAPSIRKSGLPELFDAIVMKALAKATQSRYASMREMLDDLLQVRAEEIALPHASDAGIQKRRYSLLRRLGWSLAALLCIALTYWLIRTALR
jgi:serine/threonine protein kinase